MENLWQFRGIEVVTSRGDARKAFRGGDIGFEHFRLSRLRKCVAGKNITDERKDSNKTGD